MRVLCLLVLGMLVIIGIIGVEGREMRIYENDGCVVVARGGEEGEGC